MPEHIYISTFLISGNDLLCLRIVPEASQRSKDNVGRLCAGSAVVWTHPAEDQSDMDQMPAELQDRFQKYRINLSGIVQCKISIQ